MNNLQEISFKSWKLKVDFELTKSTYDNVKKGSAEESETIEGINYAKQRDAVFPKEILQLFNSLGIDFKKETEVSHHQENENGLHIYCGWFHFKGSFDGPDCLTKLENSENKEINLTSITKKFQIGFRNANFLTAFEDRKNIVQIEFECVIPWILDAEFEPEMEVED